MRICCERLCFAAKRPATDDDDDEPPQLQQYKQNTNLNDTTLTISSPPQLQNHQENKLNLNNIVLNGNESTDTNQNQNNLLSNSIKISNNNKNRKISAINDSTDSIDSISKDSIATILTTATAATTTTTEPINNQNCIEEDQKYLIKATNTENSNLTFENQSNNHKGHHTTEISTTITTTITSDNMDSQILTNTNPNLNNLSGSEIMNNNNNNNNNSEEFIDPNSNSLQNSTLRTGGLIDLTVINNNSIESTPQEIYDQQQQQQHQQQLQHQLQQHQQQQQFLQQIQQPSTQQIILTNQIPNLDNTTNLDLETINYLQRQQQELQKRYQDHLKQQLQQLRAQTDQLCQTAANPANLVNPITNLQQGGVITAPPPSLLPLPLTLQVQQPQSIPSIPTLLSQSPPANLPQITPLLPNPILNQMQGLCIATNPTPTTAMVANAVNNVLNPTSMNQTPTEQEQHYMQLLQAKDMKIQELQRILQIKENEIAELKSHLDKFQSVFPFSRNSTGSVTPTGLGPVVRPTQRQLVQRQRAQGISAEPQSETSVLELMHVTFPKYDKEER